MEILMERGRALHARHTRLTLRHRTVGLMSSDGPRRQARIRGLRARITLRMDRIARDHCAIEDAIQRLDQATKMARR